MKYRARALAVAAMAALTVGVACYGPTEVRVEISTDRPCKAPPTAEEPNPQPVKTGVAVGASASDVVTDPPQVPHPLLTTVGHPGRIEADNHFVYYLDHGSTTAKPPGLGAVRRASSQPGPIIAVPPQEVIGGFEDVHGLALDSCVYFFATTSSGLIPARLVVYPKTPLLATATP